MAKQVEDTAQIHLAHQFRKWLIFAGWFNIVAALPIMIPVMSDWYLSSISDLNHWLGLGGEPYVPPTHPVHAILINTAGADLVLVGLFVLFAAKKPIERSLMIVLNGLFRSIFVFIVIYFVLKGLLHFFLIFALADIVIVAGYLYFLRKLKIKLF